MKEVDIVSKIVNREGGTFVPSSKGTQSIDLSDYLLKSIWDKVFEVRTDSQGAEYIFGKLPMVTQHGITMFSGEGVNVPSLASGLPFDGRTIWYNPDTQQIEVIGGTGGGSGEGVSNFWDLSGIPSWITNSKPAYSYSEITGAISTTELQNYLTSNSYLNITSGDNRYLTLSGGTITGELFVSSTSNNRAKISLISAADVPNDLVFGTNGEYHWSITSRDSAEGRDIGLYNNKEGSNGWVFKANFDTRVLDFMNTPTVNGNTIWHSDNDGSGSGLDADLLDGKHLSEIIRYEGYSNKNANKADTPQTITYWAENGGYGYTYGTALNIQGAGSWNNRIAFRTDGKIDYYQGINTDDMTHIGQLAFTSSNVASATKLQTARTIWGQSFDGTGNVDGELTIYSSSAGVISLYRTTSDGGSYVDYYPMNQKSNKWRVGAGSINEFFYETYDGKNVARVTHSPTTGTRFEVGKRYLSMIPSGTDIDRAVISLVSNSDAPTDFIMGANTYAWSLTTRGSSEDYLLGFYSALSSQYAMRIYKEGNVLVSGGITMYSDQRKKTILNHVELSLKEIANAPLIEHYYNSDEKKTTHVGSIAQYWYGLNDWFCKMDSEGFLTMEIQNAALASAISVARELDRYETKTDKAIKKLKKRICELEEEVERLKSA